ncbi:glycosyl hydrolase family 28-related protein [Sphingomonas rubra]|uniref:Pectate lyase superfamily protein n=1 Tax=Sphingomonas rubra TaxID=634430 RepID=A0A1I5S6W0_9SPHN|nr:glycosyl hydrolase family 28-related protein [Sphingomonas rubra]SFP66449.1 Pectate lyase superfamily protein [Sphingomonas rubra]
MVSFFQSKVSVGGDIPTLLNVDALRNYLPRGIRDGATVIVTGQLEPGDKNGGVYVWQDSNNDPDDGLNTVKPVTSIATGRWVLSVGRGIRGATGSIGPIGPVGPKGDGLADVMAPGGSALVGYGNRSVAAKLNDTVSVRDFGATGTGTTYDFDAITAAIDHVASIGGGSVFIPRGIYSIGNTTLKLRCGVSLIGDDNLPTILYNGPGKAVLHEAVDPNVRGNYTVKNLLISGSGTDAFTIAPASVSDISGVGIVVENIKVLGTWQNAFTFANFYGGKVQRLSTEQANIASSCYRILGSVNATHFDTLYTGDSQSHLYCLYYDAQGRVEADKSLPNGAGNVFTGLACQGGKYGLFVRCGYQLTFVAPYFENVAQPIVIGQADAARTTNIVITTPFAIGALGQNPYLASASAMIRIDNAWGVEIQSLDTRQWSRVVALNISGSGGSGARGWAVAGYDGKIHHATVTNPGSDYTAINVADAFTGTTYIGSLNAAGGLQSISVTPGSTAQLNPSCPVAVAIGDVQNVTISNPYPAAAPPVGDVPIIDTILPMIGYLTGSQGSTGVNVVGDVMSDGQTYTLRKSAGYGFYHVAEFVDQNGSPVRWVYQLPAVSLPN